MTNEMTRWNHYCEYDDSDVPFSIMHEDEDGYFVRHEDAHTEIERLQGRINGYADANVELRAEITRLKHRLKDQNIVSSNRHSEIELLRAALKVAQQSLLEFSHAQEDGPGWYTSGKDGMYQQVNLWLRRGLKAVQGALGPYDDNGQYLKEMAGAEPSSPRKRYFTHGDLLELPADAVLDEFGYYEGNEVVYLAAEKSTPEPSAPQPEQLPINRALVRALDSCVIPLWQGSVTVQNNSPDPVVVTVDQATVKSGASPRTCSCLLVHGDNPNCPDPPPSRTNI